MLFVILCTDHPDSVEKRAGVRGSHLQYLASCAERLVHAGPMLGEDGAACGSLLVVDMADRHAAEAFAAADPYAKADLFASVVIRGHRTVYRNGVLLA